MASADRYGGPSLLLACHVAVLGKRRLIPIGWQAHRVAFGW